MNEISANAPHFDGDTYSAPRDHARLTSQLTLVRNFIQDGLWHSLSEISKATGAPESSVSARLRDRRKAKFGGYTVERRCFGGTWEYRMSRHAAEAA